MPKWCIVVLIGLSLSPVPASAKQWLIAGGTGQYGDCMMEWRVEFPDLYVPNGDLARARIYSKQTCIDGDPSCDLDGCYNHSCRFRVGMCFCVEDHIQTCGPRRAEFCGDPITRPGITDIGYRFSRPLRTSRRPNEVASATKLHNLLLDAGLGTELAEPGNFVVALRRPLQAAGESCVVDNPPEFPATPCMPCTGLADLDVPLRLTKGIYKKNRLRLRARFDPFDVDSKQGDNLSLTCEPNPTPVPCPP